MDGYFLPTIRDPIKQLWALELSDVEYFNADGNSFLHEDHFLELDRVKKEHAENDRLYSYWSKCPRCNAVTRLETRDPYCPECNWDSLQNY